MRKLSTMIFEKAIIERYRRRGSSMEEMLSEMYLADISVRRVGDATQEIAFLQKIIDCCNS